MTSTRNHDDNPETSACPGCGSRNLAPFYSVRGVPVHSVLLMPSRDTAIGYPKRDIELAFCGGCGFIFNTRFRPEVHEYSSQYEETQSFSPTFNAFHRRLAATLIERYSLRGKRVLEIGCGKGEFLGLLCELGDNQGVGFDPSYVPARNGSVAASRMHVVPEFYPEDYSQPVDFVCCKMTLEHIPDTAAFVGAIGRSLAGQPATVVYLQVPDVCRIFDDVAFWDIYYEHCSYFSAGSLAHLMRLCGLTVIRLDKEYADQYLTVEAHAGGRPQASPAWDDTGTPELRQAALKFGEEAADAIAAWKRYVTTECAAGRKTVLWGGGSKAVAFLTTLGIQDEIEYVVDVNPFRQNSYIAGTGQRIVSPEFLRAYRPDTVIIMNPVYSDEIRRCLGEMGVQPEVIAAQRLSPVVARR